MFPQALWIGGTDQEDEGQEVRSVQVDEQGLGSKGSSAPERYQENRESTVADNVVLVRCRGCRSELHFLDHVARNILDTIAKALHRWIYKYLRQACALQCFRRSTTSSLVPTIVVAAIVSGVTNRCS